MIQLSLNWTICSEELYFITCFSQILAIEKAPWSFSNIQISRYPTKFVIMMNVREEEITMGNLTLDIFMCIQLEKESAANGHKK